MIDGFDALLCRVFLILPLLCRILMFFLVLVRLGFAEFALYYVSVYKYVGDFYILESAPIFGFAYYGLMAKSEQSTLGLVTLVL